MILINPTKRKSTKNAFDGDILEACRLTEETVTEILDLKKSKQARNQEVKTFHSLESDSEHEP